MSKHTQAARIAAKIEAARERGAEDALTTCRESLDLSTPYGGWDSWLINAGWKIASSALGMSKLQNSDGDWVGCAEALLSAYHEGAVEGTEDPEFIEEIKEAREAKQAEEQIKYDSYAAECREDHREYLRELAEDFAE